MKEIKKRICSKKTELAFAEITYLTLADEGKDENGTDQISLRPLRKHARLETYRVNAKISHEQIKDIEKLHNVPTFDMVGMTKLTLENESSMLQQKLIRDMMTFAGEHGYKDLYTRSQMFFHNWFGYTPKVRIKQPDLLFQKMITMSSLIASRTRRGPATFIIVSPGMAAKIMDLPQFVYNDPNQPNIDQGLGIIYSAGTLGGRFIVLVDPNMSHADQRIIMGSDTQDNDEGIYHVYMEPLYEEFDMVSPDDLMPYKNIVLSQRMALIATDETHLKFLTFEVTEKSHNIITYLLNKIFGKK
jgi:hypothetical protein